MPELNERVAKIEQQLDDHVRLADKRAAQIDDIDAKLDQLTVELARYRGVVGAVLLISTAVVTFFKLFWDDIDAFMSK